MEAKSVLSKNPAKPYFPLLDSVDYLFDRRSIPFYSRELKI
jgi:hypothetical protein